ncbi:ComEA family DNA-binding protein [Micromonospora sp. RP3T]|uniref:ComEA family DNA-binding protein n=1 Tax=Micromonospora sp. RP3T TaxID=2135446 RepID=UPI000D16541C|nr:ComEA family DNA-binding protein [Micromonospora sp. RP3T]PTA47034.1 competence protein ComEA [Micromonospora sp. RP3T]
MSDDEETAVRRRLARLFTPAGRTAAVPPPADSAPDLVGAGPPEPSVAYPSAQEPWSFPGLEPRQSEPDRSGLRGGRSEPAAGPTHPFDPHPTSTVGDAAGREEPQEPARGLAARLPGPGVFDPGRRGVRALAVVAAVVVLVAAVWAWRSRPSAEPVRSVAPVTEASAGAVTERAAPAGSSGQVVVTVAGKVRRPGLVRLPAGARLADALTAAGGALPGIDVALLNPARKVTDGELILVGVTAPPGQPAPGPAAGGGAPGGPAAGPVNLNTATLAQLDALPGVGPVLAQRILDHRDQHGGFRSVADLRQVDGIGDARYEQLKELVTV